VVIVLLGSWVYFLGGYFQLKAGQAAVLLLFGKHERTIEQAGPHFWVPMPFGDYIVIDADNELILDFGFRGKEDETTPREEVLEATMQTGDNNIVRVAFSVRYEIEDAYQAHFKVEDQKTVVRDAAQAAVRKIVGRMTVDRLLRAGKGELTSEARRVLQEHLDNYEAGLDVIGVQAQTIQAPAAVVDAFEDVLRANQNAIQAVNEAEGYRNELIPGARAEAVELLAAANGYREAKVAQATGEAARFSSIVFEYRRAPEVTKKRLFLEAMEEVLPAVDKVLVDGDATQVLPFLPIDRGNAR
jgi:membrane protease subunit HflK